MEEELTLKGLEDITSNGVKRCAICGIPINPNNDSGWEVFVEGGKKTQPICGWCDATWQPTGKSEKEEK